MAELQEPKRAMTAFFLYLTKNREQLTKCSGGKDGGSVSKLASQTWKGMSLGDRKPYEDKAVAEKAAYHKAMDEFKSAGGQVGKRRAENKENRECNSHKKLKKDRAKGCPKKPSGGGYMQYVGEHRSAVMASLPPGANKIKDSAKAVSAGWKALPADKREMYNKMFIEKQKVWKIEFEKWSKEQAAKGETAASDGDESEDGEHDDENDKDDDE